MFHFARKIMDTENKKQYGLLSKIIKSFKEFTVKNILKKYDDYLFSWQRSFYDHIIRNEQSLNHIREYIKNNPLNWDQDIDHPNHLWM